jgi:hypothetical protein
MSMHAPATGGRIRALVVGTLLALLAAELLVRQYCFWPQEIHPVLGLISAAGATVRYAREGNGTSHFTTDGVRRRAPVDRGRRPILAVGDSFSEAVQVDDDEIYSSVLERHLRARGNDVDVLDIGRSAAGPADYVRNADYYQRVFTPRWTIVQLREEDLGIGAWRAMDPTQFASFRRQPNGELAIVPPTGRSTLFTRVLPLMRRVALVNYGIGRLQNAAGIFAGAPAAAEHAPADSPAMDVLAALTRAYDGRATLLLLSSFDPERLDAVSAEGRAFDDYCARTRASCVNLRHVYRRFADEGKSPFGFGNTQYNDGHMNPDGHAAAGDLLADELGRLAGAGTLELGGGAKR